MAEIPKERWGGGARGFGEYNSGSQVVTALKKKVHSQGGGGRGWEGGGWGGSGVVGVGVWVWWGGGLREGSGLSTVLGLP